MAWGPAGTLVLGFGLALGIWVALGIWPALRFGLELGIWPTLSIWLARHHDGLQADRAEHRHAQANSHRRLVETRFASHHHDDPDLPATPVAAGPRLAR